jgi:hypothetical protein
MFFLDPFHSNTQYGLFEYSPYFFWFLGLTGKILKIFDLGKIQLFGFYFAYLSPFIIMLFFKKDILRVFLYTSFIFLLLSFFSYEDIFLIKSQELLSFVLCFAYLNFFHNKEASRKEALLLGFISGLAFGIYVPSSFFFCLIIPFLFAYEIFITKEKKNHLYFIISFLITILPYLIIQLYSLYLYGNFPLSDYYLNSYYQINSPRISYLLIPLSIIAHYLSRRFFCTEIFKFNFFILYGLFFIYFSIVFFNHFIGTIKINSLARITSAQVPIIAYFLATFFYTYFCRLKFTPHKKIKSVFFIFIFSVVVLKYYGLKKFRNMYIESKNLSIARFNTVKPCLDYFQHKKNRIYLTEGECLFINYYLPSNIKPLYIFNGDYGTRQDNYLSRVKSFDSAVNSYDNFNILNFLLDSGVTDIVVSDSNKDINFNFLISTSDTVIEKNISVILSRKFIDFLKKNFIYYSRDGYLFIEIRT